MNHNYFVFIFLLALMTSCASKTEQAVQKNPSICNEWFAEGNWTKGQYTFCGTVPTQSEYYYKTGTWQFLNSNQSLSASIVFDTVSVLVEESGGCSFSIIESRVDFNQSSFSNGWNASALNIDSIIRIFESCPPGLSQIASPENK